ncbi:MAG: alpha/beta hydrolase [Pseudomonadota bacterium]
MSTLLLVHGGWAGGWAWDPVLPALDALNVSYTAIDLPGHGARRRAMWSVSLNDYADAVIEAAEQIDGRVVTVGHSSGGYVITAAAGRSPESFDELVYLAGFVPVAGERLMQLALGDKASKLAPGVTPNPLLGRIALHPKVFGDAFFHDCTAADEENFARQVELNPLRVGIKKLQLKPGFSEIPKSYVLCTNDQAVTTDYQRWMAKRSSVPIKHELACGHMPMSAATEDLARVLATYAA